MLGKRNSLDFIKKSLKTASVKGYNKFNINDYDYSTDSQFNSTGNEFNNEDIINNQNFDNNSLEILTESKKESSKNLSNNYNSESTKQARIKTYLNNGKALSDEELDQFSILNTYAPWLFDPERMGYKKYSGYDYYYDYNGYVSYDDLIAALAKNGLTTDDIDASLPSGETIDWEKVKSAYSKGITNMDLALSLKLKDKPYSAFISDKSMIDFIARIEYYSPEEVNEAYKAFSTGRINNFQDYIDSKEGEINQKEGMMKALEFLATVDLDDPKGLDYIKTHLKGLQDGLDQYFNGVGVFISPSDGLSRNLTTDQYEAIFIAAILSKSNSNVKTIFGDFNGLEKVYNLSMAEGNMIPTVVVGTFTSLIGAGQSELAFELLGRVCGASTMYVSATGNAVQNAYQQGYDVWSSWLYGSLKGASESGLEFLLGGLPGVSKIADKNILTRILSEGFEESLQEVIDPFLRHAVLDEPLELDPKKIIKAGIDGMIIAAYFNGGEIAINGVASVSIEVLQDNYDTIKALEDAGVEIDYGKLTEDEYIESLKDKTAEIKSTEITDYYGDLEQKISDSMPKGLSELEKSKYIYNNINKLMEYNLDYTYGSKEYRSNVSGQEVDVNNITNNKVICDTWADMFCQLLQKNGVDAKVMGNKHRWVVFELKDGTKWAADATQAYNGMTDLASSKLGLESGGFFQITDEMFNSEDLLENSKFRFVDRDQFNIRELLKKIDTKIGSNYSDISNYFKEIGSEAREIKTEALDVAPNATDGQIALAKFEKIILPQISKLNGMEIMSYYSAICSQIFDSYEQSIVKCMPEPSPNGNGYNVIFKIDLDDGSSINYICNQDGTVTKEAINNTE